MNVVFINATEVKCTSSGSECKYCEIFAKCLRNYAKISQTFVEKVCGKFAGFRKDFARLWCKKTVFTENYFFFTAKCVRNPAKISQTFY